MRTTRVPAVRPSLLIGTCALLLGAAPKADAQLRASLPADSAVLKDPATARVRAILPGAGHWYAGERWRAAFVPTAMMVILVEGMGRNEREVACYYDIPPERNCVTASPDAIAYAAAAGVLALSIWDAGRAAERTNARRRQRTALLSAPRPGGGRSGHRVGLSIPLGGDRR